MTPDIQQQLRDSIAGVEPAISPPPALGPPIIGTDTAGSAPGVPSPTDTGQNQLPPSFPLGAAGTWMPPPQVGMGGNAPFATPVVPPGTGPTYTVPTFGSGSATSPAISTFFPAFTAAGPFQPIVLTAIMNTSLETSSLPTTPGTAPIVQSTTAPPVILGPPFSFEAEAARPPLEPAPEPDDERNAVRERERQRQEQRKRELDQADEDDFEGHEFEDEREEQKPEDEASRTTVTRTTVTRTTGKKKKKR